MTKKFSRITAAAAVILLVTALCLTLSVTAGAASAAKKLTLAVGECGYIYTGADSSQYVWKSSDEAVATVNNGAVTAYKKGNAKITASKGGKDTVYSVTVTKYRIEKAGSSMSVGEGMQLRFKGASVSAAVEWTSSDTSVLTVNEYGYVTALKEGSAKIKGIRAKRSPAAQSSATSTCGIITTTSILTGRTLPPL